MADTLLFIHGTGVRQEGYDQTMKLLTEGLAKVGLDAKVEGLCGGSDLGTKVDDEAIRAVLPLSLTKSATPSPEDLGWQAALWTALLDDPLVELRMAAMREPPVAHNYAVPGAGPTPDVEISDAVETLRQNVKEPLPGGIKATDLRVAALWLQSQPLLAAAAGAVGDAQDRDLVYAVARALVARALLERRGEPGTGPDALYVTEDRDALVAAVALMLAPETKGLGSWLWNGVKGFAEGKATAYSRERRFGLMNGASPVIGDILFYEKRGGSILQAIEEKVLQLAAGENRVIALGHSLGGIMLVDLLTALRPKPLPVVKLITVGSQAPMLFKFDALEVMRLNNPLPEGAPYRPWLNFFDRNDFLSFCAERAFGQQILQIEDFEITSNVPFPEAHSAYFRQPAFYKKLLTAWPQP